MQRTNNILRYRNKKPAFAMMMAIAVIVILSSIMALGLYLSTKSSKKTADIYLYTQAVLEAHSAAEYSLLKIAQGGPCSPYSLNFKQDGIYEINITNRFVYTDPLPIECKKKEIYATVITPEQNGSVLMDISVSVTDPTIVSEPIRYFKRSLQKL